VIGGEPQYQELLVPVFIENRWFNFQNRSYLTFKEISSFSFRVYYDDRVLDFLDVQKHHPFTDEEAVNLRSTHFFNTGGMMDYYQPLSANFNLVAANQRVTDFYKYFNINDVSMDRPNPPLPAPPDPFHPRVGSAVTVSGTASSFHNLPTTNNGEYKVLVYLKFRVRPFAPYAGNPTPGGTRTGKIYFDPTYICYNGVNIAKERGDKLLEKYPTANTDPNYNNFLAAFRPGTGMNIPRGIAADNMPYLDPAWTNDRFTREEAGLVGIQKYNNYVHTGTGANRYNADPYLSGSITVRVMNNFPEFRFEIINQYQSLIDDPGARIVRDIRDTSK
jgi:hypothetical protein